MRDIHHILKEYWGYSSFRPKQEEIIRHVLAGKDALALLPTGGGKSICFQVPAMAMDGLCIVISPLIALMKDQVENLRKKGITAFAIVSGMSFAEVKKTLELAVSSNCRFLYVSPERLTTRLFRQYLPAMPISLIAVDEAHCISQWGYDFRPPYLKIAEIREQLPGVPVLALTASATPEVQNDICEKLNFKNGAVFQTSFARPNLSYSVREVDVKITAVTEILNKVPGCGIVYCRNRKRTKDIATLLSQQGISADFYHAGLSAEERSNKQEAWIRNKTRVMVCTNAFGMGIDKPDVRIVIHYDVPDALEHYYQEAGRAGRDTQKAYAVLLYQKQDLDDLERQPDIRYPTQEDIRETYRALVNYLQLPVGNYEGIYHNFDFQEFVERFGLQAHQAMHSLKAIEQDGWMAISEKAWQPAKAGFVCSREYLREIQNTKPEWSELILALLRGYEGIFDHIVPIREKKLAFATRMEEAEVKQLLERLHKAGVIRYEPMKDTPQICFLTARVPVEQFAIRMDRHLERKEVYRRRIAGMIRYTLADTECRAVIIGKNFGDATITVCGICDNCIRKRKAKAKPDPKALRSVESRIRELLSIKPMHFKELIPLIDKEFGEDVVAEALQRMEKESLLSISATGMTRLLD